jgi:hypothetical protein
MMAVAPNLTILVGELVGARLISHAGSLLNLAKHPSSTIQILGAEKALFRAMKTKHDTPKYGLIYHASLVGQTSAKLKGKVSRMLAAKAALAIRVDALGEETDATLGIEQRADLEKKFSILEQNSVKIKIIKEKILFFMFFLSLNEYLVPVKCKQNLKNIKKIHRIEDNLIKIKLQHCLINVIPILVIQLNDLKVIR